MDTAQIITIILAILGFLFGGIYLGKFKRIVKESKELFDVLDKALKDNKITREELKNIIKEALDIIAVFKR